MRWLNDAIASGMVFDLIAVLMVVEALGLIVHARTSGRGLGTRAILASIGAGFFLVVAFKSVISGASAAWTGFFLSGALAAHVVDLEGRLRR